MIADSSLQPESNVSLSRSIDSIGLHPSLGLLCSVPGTSFPACMSFEELAFSGLPNARSTVPMHCSRCFRIVDVPYGATTCSSGHLLTAPAANPLMHSVTSSRAISATQRERINAPSLDDDQALLNQLFASLNAGVGDSQQQGAEQSTETLRAMLAQRGLDDLMQNLLASPSLESPPASKAFLASLSPRALTQRDFVQIALRFQGIERDVYPTLPRFGGSASLFLSHAANEPLKTHFELRIVAVVPLTGDRINNAGLFTSSSSASSSTSTSASSDSSSPASIADASNNLGTAALLERGKIPFVQKCRNVQLAGARAAIVIQTGIEWPYTMTDATNSGADVSIPCLMISAEDGERVIKALGRSPSTRATVKAISRWKVLTCSICIDDFSLNDEATLLPCQHAFHEMCIRRWLEKRAQCPLCRMDLPTEGSNDSAKEMHKHDLQELQQAMYN